MNATQIIFDRVKAGELFTTGSRVWELHHEGSDWDFFCNPETFLDLKKELSSIADLEQSEYYEGVKFRDGDYIINFSPVPEKEINQWKIATCMFNSSQLQTFLRGKDKAARISLFQSLRTMLLLAGA